jgi:hypothetical protein
MIVVFYKLNSAIERGRKPDALGWKLCPYGQISMTTSILHSLQALHGPLLGLPATWLLPILPRRAKASSEGGSHRAGPQRLAEITGAVPHPRLRRSESLVTEHRSLRPQRPGRGRLREGERATRATMGQPLSPQAPAEGATIVTPAPILL